MRHYLVTIAALLAIISCGNVSTSNRAAKAEQEAREKFVMDSMLRAQAVQDSIRAVEKAAENQKVIAKMKPLYREKKDEFSTSTFYIPKKAPMYRNRNGVYCYFGSEDGVTQYNFRFVYQYYADDWLFIRSLIFNIDGDIITVTPKMETDCGDGGKIWEWCDENVNYNSAGIDEDFILKIANAKSVKVKMNGSQYYDTRTLTAEQIKSIKDTYDYYVAMGGKFMKSLR